MLNRFVLSSDFEIENYLAHSFKTKFNVVFTENLVCCTKVKATLKLKPDFMLVFRPKHLVSYATLDVVEKSFEKIDLSNAFLQTEVDEDSKELLTINTQEFISLQSELSHRLLYSNKRWILC